MLQMVLNISFFCYLSLAGKSTCQNLQGRKQYGSETALPLLRGKAVSVGKNKAGTQQVVNFNWGFPNDSGVGLDSHLTQSIRFPIYKADASITHIL